MLDKLVELQNKIQRYIDEKETFNEEETKMALILPLLQWLGYDIFNPREVKAEVPFDFKSSRGDKERVDYGLVISGHTKVIIEAKPFLEKLTNAHMAQLKRYYATDVGTKYGILTNGVEYLFFADTQHQNIMDDKPFYSMDLSNPLTVDTEILSYFKKESMQTNDLGIPVFVEKMNLKEYLFEQFKQPSSAFLEFLKQEIQAKYIGEKEIVEVVKELAELQYHEEVAVMVSRILHETENHTMLEFEETNDMLTEQNSVKEESLIVLASDENDEGSTEVKESKVKTIVSEYFQHRRLHEGKEQHSIFLPADYQEYMIRYCDENDLTKHEFINAILKEEETNLNGKIEYSLLECVLKSNDKRPWATVSGGVQNTIYFVPEIMDIVKESMNQNRCTKSEPVIYALEQFMNKQIQHAVAI